MNRLAALAENGPADKHAVVCMDGKAPLTWSDADKGRASVAAALRRGPPCEPVLATSEPFGFFVALLGCWAAGRNPVVPCNLQPETIAQFTQGDRVVIDDAWLGGLGDPPGRVDAAAWTPDCGLTMYTSGSSGAPKAIWKSLRQLGDEVDVLAARWGDRYRGTTVLATVPHQHLYGLLFRVLLPVVLGSPFDRRTCLDVDELLVAIARHGPHVLLSSPAHFARLPQLLTFDRWRPRPRALFSSGAPLESETAAVYRTVFGEAPIEILGSTESGGVAWRCRDGGATDDRWTPLPSVDVERSEDGALIASSPWSGGAARLEDEIAVEDDGRFRLGARMDRIVKLEGKRVSLPELEVRLAAHPWVEAAAVEPVAALGRLGAVLVLSPSGASVLAGRGRAALTRALREHLRATMERVAIPRRFRIAAQLPLSERGKIDRTALLALLSDDHDVAA